MGEGAGAANRGEGRGGSMVRGGDTTTGHGKQREGVGHRKVGAVGSRCGWG